MDELDGKIIAALRRNGRERYLKISKQLQVSEATVRNHVLALEKEGVIQGYEARVDPRKTGFDAVAFVGLDVEALKFLKVTEALARLSEIQFLATGTGEHMILMEVWMHNQEEVTRFINEKISVMDGVSKISPTIILQRVPLKKPV